MYRRRLRLVFAFASLVSGLRTAPGSPCSSQCGNVLSSTSGQDMACTKGDYSGSSSGIVLNNCLTCQATSRYQSGNETDLHWMLYNMRYNLGYCVWGDLGGPQFSTPCTTSMACESLYDAIRWKNYTLSGGTYDFCSAWINDENFVPKCFSCLEGMQNQDAEDYLGVANYLTMLDAACLQQPKPGNLVSTEGKLVGVDPIIITTPQPSYVSVPTEDYGPISLGARVGIAFGGLTVLLFIAGFIIVCNGKRRRRAFLRDLERRHADQGWPHPKTRYGGSSGGDMFETPVSQRPLRGWDESPVSAGAEPGIDRPLPRYFSPYSSQYNSPVSATDAPSSSVAGANWPTLSPQQLGHIIQEQSPAHGSPPPAFTQWPSPAQEQLMMQMHHERRQAEIAIGIALGGDDASLRSKNSNPNLGPYGSNGYPLDKKGKERDESYEMVESPYNSSNSSRSGGGDPTAGAYQMPAEPDAPVLHHPGYGRHHGSRPGTGGTNNSSGIATRFGGLTESDMRRGNAL